MSLLSELLVTCLAPKRLDDNSESHFEANLALNLV